MGAFSTACVSPISKTPPPGPGGAFVLASWGRGLSLPRQARVCDHQVCAARTKQRPKTRGGLGGKALESTFDMFRGFRALCVECLDKVRLSVPALWVLPAIPMASGFVLTTTATFESWPLPRRLRMFVFCFPYPSQEKTWFCRGHDTQRSPLVL